jgi:hypothetical protein
MNISKNKLFSTRILPIKILFKALLTRVAGGYDFVVTNLETGISNTTFIMINEDQVPIVLFSKELCEQFGYRFHEVSIVNEKDRPLTSVIEYWKDSPVRDGLPSDGYYMHEFLPCITKVDAEYSEWIHQHYHEYQKSRLNGNGLDEAFEESLALSILRYSGYPEQTIAHRSFYDAATLVKCESEVQELPSDHALSKTKSLFELTAKVLGDNNQ